MTLQLKDGTQRILVAGDAAYIPPNHDAWVNGQENLIMVDVSGSAHYSIKGGKAAKESIIGEELIVKRFSSPDRVSQMKHGKFELLNFSDCASIGKVTFEPGWKWSTDVKPIAQTESCMHQHVGLCTQGSCVIQMDNGQRIQVYAGEMFQCEPGHDCWVIGQENCIMYDFKPQIAQYAQQLRKD